MARNMKDCCGSIRDLFRNNKISRATITTEFFREIVGRSRIEGSFIEALNEHAMEHFKFGILRLDPYKFLVFKTTDKFFKEDTHVPEEDDD